MKMKYFLVGLLSLATLGVSTPHASAFLFHCIKQRLQDKRFTICCRPYNAFTPVCFGSITCNGCCPVQFCPPQNCFPPAAMGPLWGGNGACCAPGSHGEPMVNWAPGMSGFEGYNGQPSFTVQPGPASNGTTPTFIPPPPTPVNPASPMGMTYNAYGVQQTGYYPMYYPSYGYQQMPQAVPNYWYGQGW
jgi:hypothetical protein